MIKPRMFKNGSTIHCGNVKNNRIYKIVKGFRFFNICFIYVLLEIKKPTLLDRINSLSKTLIAGWVEYCRNEALIQDSIMYVTADGALAKKIVKERIEPKSFKMPFDDTVHMGHIPPVVSNWPNTERFISNLHNMEIHDVLDDVPEDIINLRFNPDRPSLKLKRKLIGYWGTSSLETSEIYKQWAGRMETSIGEHFKTKKVTMKDEVETWPPEPKGIDSLFPIKEEVNSMGYHATYKLPFDISSPVPDEIKHMNFTNKYLGIPWTEWEHREVDAYSDIGDGIDLLRGIKPIYSEREKVINKIMDDLESDEVDRLIDLACKKDFGVYVKVIKEFKDVDRVFKVGYRHTFTVAGYEKYKDCLEVLF